MTRVLCVFFILIATKALAQEPIQAKLNGKVSTGLSELEGVYIINLKTEKAAITDKEGRFSIPAAVGDTIMFSAIQFKVIKINLSKEYFEQDLFSVTMMPIVNQLKEVIVNENSKITAENLGIIPFGQKKYTAAERRLETAGDFKPIMLLSLLGGSMPLDPLINKINGRTKRLKKLVVLEKKEENVKLISELYNQEYLTVKLGIPTDYVNGFKYFAVENEKFTAVLKSNNKTMTTFLIGELATKYNEIIASEKK
jgi:hypothetical protein